MPLVKEIVEFLRASGQIVRLTDTLSSKYEEHITGICPITRTRPNCISWASRSYLSSQPNSITNTDAGLVFVPEATLESTGGRIETMIVECQNPRLAFILVLERFFSEAARTSWPQPSEGTLFPGTVIGSDTFLAPGVVAGSNVQIGSNVRIAPNTVIANCTIGNNVQIGANCTIGMGGFGYEKNETGEYIRFPHHGLVVIEDNVEIGSNTCIDRGGIDDTRIGKGSKIDNLVHIGHNVVIGENVLVIANAMIGGSVAIGKEAWVSPSASVKNKIEIGDFAVIGMGATVLKNVQAGETVVGNPARLLKKGN